jgi:hypothetical protein
MGSLMEVEGELVVVEVVDAVLLDISTTLSGEVPQQF